MMDVRHAGNPEPGDGVNQADPRSDSAELRRIDFTGTIWFAAAAIASALALAGLLDSGWRPQDMPPVAAIAWWTGSGCVVLGIAAFAWAGCPVLNSDVSTADRIKSLCIRWGVVLFMAGAVVASLAILLVPPQPS
jgi:hypothetical protein